MNNEKKKYDKQIAIRISVNLEKIAWNNIKIRSTFSPRKPENFSEYIRNLIIEDSNRNKKIIKNQI